MHADCTEPKLFLRVGFEIQTIIETLNPFCDSEKYLHTYPFIRVIVRCGEGRAVQSGSRAKTEKAQE